ncbi:MAG: hypothetical protein II034_01795, partial [Muribaculaceae bacterium]|nr:hypothetical protein [Muribaculaceae bacterium]
MDESLEKKPKRPRIGENKPAIEENEIARYEKVNYTHEAPEVPQTEGSMDSEDQQNNNGGYQQRPS